jgi:hypothetical protein
MNNHTHTQYTSVLHGNPNREKNEEIKHNKLETRTATWRKKHNSQHICIHSNVTYL